MTNPLAKLFRTDAIETLARALEARTKNENAVLAVPVAIASAAQAEFDDALAAAAGNPANKTACIRLAAAFPALVFWKQNSGTAQNLLAASIEAAGTDELRNLTRLAADELRSRLAAERVALVKSCEGYGGTHPGATMIDAASNRLDILENLLAAGTPTAIRAAAGELVSIAQVH